MEDSHLYSVSNGQSGATSCWHAVKPFANGGMARVLQSLLREIPHHHPAKIILDKVPGGMILASLPYAVMFGSYETLRRKAISANGGVPLPFYHEAVCGILAATSTSFVFVPRLEIEKLIVADANLPATQRVNYKSTGHAISCIVAKKGISGLWKSQYQDSVRFDESCARFGASVVSGLATPICCTPFRNFVDFMQFIKSQAGQRRPPISSIDCAFKMLKFCGHFKFFNGLSGNLFAWSPFLMTLSVFRDTLQEVEELNGW